MSAGTLAVLSSLKPYLIGLSVALVGLGLFRVFRPKAACGCGPLAEPRTDRKPHPAGRWWVVSGAVLTALVLAWPALSSRSAAGQKEAGGGLHLEAQAFVLSGFDQECCVGLVEHSLKQVEGYHRCEADLKSRKLTVWFDPQVSDAQRIEKAINVAGYRATLVDDSHVSSGPVN